jgi:hypothetical protein
MTGGAFWAHRTTESVSGDCTLWQKASITTSHTNKNEMITVMCQRYNNVALHNFCCFFNNHCNHIKFKLNPWRYSSDEPWPAEQPPLAVFPDCTRRYWVDMSSAHRIPQLHFQLSKPNRYFFIQVTTQFIRSWGWVDQVPDPTTSEKS